MAAAEVAMFDDVVVSNNKDLVKQIFLWSDALRTASTLEEFKSGSISAILNEYKDYAIRSFITYNGIFMGPGYDVGDDSIWRKKDYCKRGAW